MTKQEKQRLATKRWRERNPTYSYYQKNREERIKKQREWQAANGERVKEINKRSRQSPRHREWEENYRKENADLIKEIRQRYYQKNKYKFYHWAALRRKQIRKQTPQWANLEAIKHVYKTRQEIEAKTGTPHHVDHIIPLRGDYISGLHVADNLQVIPATKNLQKGNKWKESHHF